MSLKASDRESLISALIKEIGGAAAERSFSPASFAKVHNVSPQSVYRYLRQLEEQGKISRISAGRSYVYSLVDHESVMTVKLPGANEDAVWNRELRPLLNNMPETAFNNCHHAFTEMLNNAIDHSEGDRAVIVVKNNGFRVQIGIDDNGVGIFSKIAAALGLEEKRFAVLELAKGKITTDPASHSGEGIFFSSKAVDSFAISSDGLAFYAGAKRDNEFLIDHKFSKKQKGTLVLFEILFDHKQTMRELFDKYTQESDHYGFSKTVVPVRLLEYGDDSPTFVSRSQAKRLLVRFERFEHIVLDFAGISEIGQGFADEVFRVFASRHPGTELVAKNCSFDVQNMINHVLHAAR